MQIPAGTTPVKTASRHTPASVTELRMPLNYYPPSPPETLPSLLNEGWPRNIYPYARRTSASDGKPVVKEWRVLRLANEFLEVDILPELGGHVWGARDRLRDAELFHRVDAIKPRDLGVAGPWVATGIEFNFPVTHSILTLDEIVAAHGTEADGSAWVCIGASDKLFGLRWQIHLRLRPGSRMLHISGWLHNPTENEHPWCYWGNAGVPVHESLRLYYPFTWAEHHGGLQFQWPFEHGRNLTYFRELPEPVSIFGETGDARWFGAYYDAFGRGVVHTADPKQVPGKKYFSWGHGAAGERWADLLSDNRTGYVEIQSGSRNDQEFWNVLKPHETYRFAECWQPVDALGGITSANEHLVLHLERQAGGVAVRAQAPEALSGVEFSASAGGRELARWTAHLAPETVHERLVPAPGAEPLRVEARPADRASLLVAEERPPCPERPPSREEQTDYAEVSAPAYRRIGLDAAQSLNWILARTFLEAALELAPKDPATLREVGLFRLRRFEYASAAKAMERALRLSPVGAADRSLRWGLWWARFQAPKRVDARAAAALAEKLLQDDADLLDYARGLLALRAGRFAKPAGLYADRPLLALVSQRDLAVLKLVGARLAGAPDAALLAEMRRQFPSDPTVACEAGAEAFEGLLRVDSDAGVTVACEYAKLHDFAQALQALEAASCMGGWTLSRRLLAAYLADRAGRKKEAAAHLAADAPFDGVSDRPWQELFYRVLPWALERQPGNARALFLWGNLLVHAGRAEEGLAAWNESVARGGAWPTLHFSVALLQTRLGGASGEQIARMKAVVERDGRWEFAGPYLDVLRLSGRRRERLEELRRRLDQPDRYERIPILYALESCAIEDMDRALEVLLTTKFPPTHGGGLLSYSHIRLRMRRAERALDRNDLTLARVELDEGDKILHQFQEDVQVLRTRAALLCVRGRLEEACVQPEAARAAYEAALAEEHDLRSPLRLYQAWALLKLGRKEEGEKLIARIERMAQARLRLPHPYHATYLHLLSIVAKFRGDRAEHDRLLQQAVEQGALFINWNWGF